MTVLNIIPCTGRYHATPWGQQVNEGAVEWPPSPWRLLRALLATWHHKAKKEISPKTISSLIEVLANVLPEFELPPATAGHTRHYMPYIEGKNQKTTKVFDTFAHIATGHAIRVRWPVELSSDQEFALKTLVERMNYFGRAESLVEITPSTEPFTPNAEPLLVDGPTDDNVETVRLLAPYPPSEYLSWREGFLDATKSAHSKSRGRKNATSDLPASLLEALQVDTIAWKGAGWNRPPGSRWVNYTRPRPAFSAAPVSRARQTMDSNVQVARFALSGNVLPTIREALSISERLHQALVKWSDSAPVFTGRAITGEPLRGHNHAYILCEPEASGRWIKHVSVYAPHGFAPSARRALEKLRGIWGRGGHDLTAVLVFAGASDEARELSPLFGVSREWISLTPFVSTRHAKIFNDGRPKVNETGIQIGSPEHDLRRLLASGDLPEPVEITPIPRYHWGVTRYRWLQFMQYRKHGDGRRSANQPGTGFHLTFPEPVSGPIALGYGAHFGLGLFVPVGPR